MLNLALEHASDNSRFCRKTDRKSRVREANALNMGRTQVAFSFTHRGHMRFFGRYSLFFET